MISFCFFSGHNSNKPTAKWNPVTAKGLDERGFLWASMVRQRSGRRADPVVRPKTSDRSGIYSCKPVTESHGRSNVLASADWRAASVVPPFAARRFRSAKFGTLFSLHKKDVEFLPSSFQTEHIFVPVSDRFVQCKASSWLRVLSLFPEVDLSQHDERRREGMWWEHDVIYTEAQ